MADRILIVDDEPAIVELLEFNLRQAGYEVAVARDGQSTFAALEDRLPDLVILDLMLPDVAGTEICRRIRRDERTAHIPIVMLTARGGEIDRVVGFELGADDYVVKPFSIRELVLRIGAVLRRRAAGGEEEEPFRLRLGDLDIDASRHTVHVRGAEIDLTAMEFRLLLDLAKRRGRVQSRDLLLERVWGYAPGIETRTVDTHVKRLREKLGPARRYIETVRGVGYRLREA